MIPSVDILPFLMGPEGGDSYWFHAKAGSSPLPV